MSNEQTTQSDFRALALPEPLLKALDSVGYETPSPIQALTIPLVASGRDVVGQAQTGTGKTAAFALPLLARIDLEKQAPQVLVLTPTRELAIQVAEAFQRYAAFLQDFRVLPVYGGQDFAAQLRQLKRGVHVVVGTPGRIMDHIRRTTLDLTALSCLVLDEADEMLRMGFLDDVEWILEQTPPERQIALFSATMPPAIRRIAQQHLQDPEEITIKLRTTAADTIRQRFLMVGGYQKLEALTRILEAESFEGMIVFVRTKTATVELAEKLAARGFASEALNGDIPQHLRERTVERLRNGKIDILVATDVAARGLDVERISHVLNYDIPYDSESYVHRIGRTGRAGRSGEAILFIVPREKRMLYTIEKATKQKIEVMELPTTEAINIKRIADFKNRISDTLAGADLELFYKLVEEFQQEHNVPALEIAAALAKLLQGDSPLLLSKKDALELADGRDRRSLYRSGAKAKGSAAFQRKGMATFRIDVGRSDGVKPANIVGAIANEAGISSEFIGRIDLYDVYSTVDLPEITPMKVLNKLKNVRVAGKRLNISRTEDSGFRNGTKKKAKEKGKDKKKKKKKRIDRKAKVVELPLT